MRIRSLLAAFVALICLAALSLSSPAQAAGKVILVCSGTAGCPPTPKGVPVYKSIAVGVSHAQNGDWVMVWPGYYREAVTIAPRAGLTSGLHIRGMQRNGVVLDGKKASGSGIHINGVNNTWVQNMTAEHYHQGTSNGFFWTGVDGYWGTHLTAYDNGEYGVYAFESTSSGKTPAAFAYVDGSWSGDSGIYIGGCNDCHAVVTNSRAHKNAIGYSGTNAGGELYLLNSEWDNNATGLLPNTLQSEPDPPQRGTTIVDNYIHDNNANDVPGTGISGIAPVGVGVGLAGGWDNIVRHNTIVNNKHVGVLMVWLITPPVNNQILYNTFKHNGYSGSPGDADIAIDGTGIQNCIYRNTRAGGGPATVDPPVPMGANSCGPDNPLRASAGRGLYSPGDPVVSVMSLLNAAGITEPKSYKGPGKHPEAQLTMANPCAGAPANPWCANGKPRFSAPASPGR